jgi:hypothetical protein
VPPTHPTPITAASTVFTDAFLSFLMMCRNRPAARAAD